MPTNDLLTAKEAAHLLRLTPAAVRKMCACGLLAHSRLSARAIRIPRDAIDRFLRATSNNEVGVPAAAQEPHVITLHP